MKNLGAHPYIFVKSLDKYEGEISIFKKLGGHEAPRLYVIPPLYIKNKIKKNSVYWHASRASIGPPQLKGFSNNSYISIPSQTLLLL